MIEAVLFLASLTYGLLLRIVFVLEKSLAKSTKLLPVTYILDSCFALVAIVGFALLTFLLCQGEFFFFMSAAAVIGFFAMRVVV